MSSTIFYQLGDQLATEPIVEQDHRFIKRITKPMMGFKAFHSANATLIGIELCHMLSKGQPINAASLPVYEQFYALAA